MGIVWFVNLSFLAPPRADRQLVERDFLTRMEEMNYENSGVDVGLTLAPPDLEKYLKSCSFCGATKTPLWRSGPFGPKTLCNACGIRHRKLETQVNTELTLGPTPPLNPAGGRRNRSN